MSNRAVKAAVRLVDLSQWLPTRTWRIIMSGEGNLLESVIRIARSKVCSKRAIADPINAFCGRSRVPIRRRYGNGRAIMTISAKHELLRDRDLDELEFLMKTELLRATSDVAKKRLLQSMKHVRFKAGERFISQGEPGDCFYVIQSGLCVVRL
jgi:hypothetical protein